MFYTIWFLGVMLAVMFSALIAISGEKSGKYEE